MTADLYHGQLRDQFLPLTMPTMLWIKTHQPWARFVIHQSLTTTIECGGDFSGSQPLSRRPTRLRPKIEAKRDRLTETANRAWKISGTQRLRLSLLQWNFEPNSECTWPKLLITAPKVPGPEEPCQTSKHVVFIAFYIAFSGTDQFLGLCVS